MSAQSTVNILSTLSDLIAFPSVSNELVGTEECFRYLRKYLNDRGLHVSLLRSHSFPSIVATTHVTKHPKVLLQAHMDVVTADKPSFKLTERDGKLYGRGTFDMKFAAACYLQLVEDLKTELQDYDFGVMFTSDEELGGENGVGYLLENGYSTDVCMLPDGGADWQLETACNGVWMIRLISTGQDAHGSRPWEGKNAINNLMEGLSEIRLLFGELKPHKSSVTISQISGGVAINQVPGHAEATLDMRFVDDEHYKVYRKSIELIAEARQLKIETEAQCEATHIDMKHPEIVSFLSIAERLRGKPLERCHSFGGSDARYFAERKIPTIIIRPTGGGAHSDHEWLDKAEFLEFYDLVKTYVIETAKIA